MKYRIQFNAVFNNSDANDILNKVESIKSNVYKEESYTVVPIIRMAKKVEFLSELKIPTEYETVDFNTVEDNHTGLPIGTSFGVMLDVSFTLEKDALDLLNYLETKKNNANSNDIRECKWFICRHEESEPLSKDGNYSYMDFDKVRVEYSIFNNV